MNPKKYDLGYAEVMILTAVGVFFILAFGHWLLGCSMDSSCNSNADCPVGAFCDFSQPVGPICIPINDVVEEDGGTAVPSRLPSNLPCPICTSMEFPVGCIIGTAITCATTVEDCPGVACDGGTAGSDAGDPGSDSGSDAGVDTGSDAAATTDAAEPAPPSCGDPICDYDWCGTMYNQNCASVWDGDGECDCGCQFFDIDCM